MVTRERAAEIVSQHFGPEGAVEELPGEVDQNFRVRTDSGDFVLKISPDETSAARLAARQFAMHRLSAAGLPYRFPTPATGAETLVPLPEGGTASLTTWIDGETFGVAGRPLNMVGDIGRLAGSVVRALEGFDHPSLHEPSMWNLAEAPRVVRELIRHVRLPTDRELIEDVLDHLMVRLPELHKLPQQVIHGDINDLNVLVDDGSVVGLIDFGDLIHTWRVAEVAIAATYAMLDADDPLGVAADVVAGFCEVVTLTASEAGVIYDLIRTRLAVSAVIAASRRAEGNPHHAVSADAVWEMLDRLDHVDAIVAASRLAAAAGHSEAISDHDAVLRQRRAATLGGSLSLSYESSPTGPLHIVRGEGVHLFDALGRRFLDCVNNVAHVGHSNPDVFDAATDQMLLLNTNTRYLHDNVVRYAERLLDKLPEQFEKVYFVNSGSEANELALRMARAVTGRRAMAVLEHGYHGNTSAMVELSPYKFRGPGGDGQPDWVTVLPVDDDGDHRATVDWLLDERQPVAGLIAEAIVGCGGQLVPAPGVLESCYAAVRQRGGVCIADEVQTGFGRVGSPFWAFELSDLRPDIVTMGKPIGNGHPLGAVAVTSDVARAFENGMEYFNTFGGNPVSAAVGLAVLDVIEHEELQANAAKVGEYLRSALAGLMSDHPEISDVRGAGLFLGIEFSGSDGPNPDLTRHVVDYAKESGVLLSIDGPDHNVIKIKPPMVFSVADADKVIATVARALRSVSPTS